MSLELKPVNTKFIAHLERLRNVLPSNPRILAVEDIAKETSLSTKTVARLEKMMIENHILQFAIFTNPSSTQLTGFIEFGV
jgi:hypothetical protein